MAENKKIIYTTIKPDVTEVDEVKKLVKELTEALEKANSLYDQLASRKDIVISVSFTKKD